MGDFLRLFVAFLGATFRPRLSLQLENLALRHQLGVFQRTETRPRIRILDRILWSWLSRLWSGWRDAAVAELADVPEEPRQ